jgi:serine/threonine protein phosphatase PrpC
VNDPFAYLDTAALTDIGRKRKQNEDSMLATPEVGVFCIADGMGGSEAGKLASATTVEYVKRAVARTPKAYFRLASDKVRILSGAMRDANEWIWRHARDRGMRSCGTTVVALILDDTDPGRGTVLHAGDSRAYRLRDNDLRQITGDHSFAAATGIKDESLLPDRFRNIITRAVGIGETIVIEETPVGIAAGDLFVVCSDGLTRMIPDAHIREILSAHAEDSAGVTAQALVDEANEAGGYDNISVIVVRVRQPER